MNRNGRLIEIPTIKGELYRIDEETLIIFKNGIVLPSQTAQLVYSHLGDKDTPPKISGIWLKESNSILTLTGRIHPLVTDINSVY